MNSDHTLRQTGDERRRAQQLSLKRTRPPTEVPGYEPVRFLGEGAYGEVWVAIDRNTGRHVAIKFYAHRGGLDWTLLAREVEKLRFLFADRYVVQLLDVGWDSEPPFYVMEYVEQGSLADAIEREGSLGVERALQLFRDLSVGLTHAHDKGVLHCDLKPANVLLDEDFKPRLADFGQARLSDEQSPALGTLFYMAPEQADMSAVPDASWDVYALGALLYTMLTGSPPYRTEAAVREIQEADDLQKRLAVYQRKIRESPRPTAHRQVRGVDRALGEIIERCLAVDPRKRYPNVRAVLDDLDARAVRRARRPLLVMGAVGPLLLLCVISVFGMRGFQEAVQQSREALTQRALTTNLFAADSVAKAVFHDIEDRFRAVKILSRDERLKELLQQAVADPRVAELSEKLLDQELSDDERTALHIELIETKQHRMLEARLAELAADPDLPPVYSWFVTDAQGTQLARIPVVHDLETGQGITVGKNYAWRSYFHGGSDDLPEGTMVPPDEHVREPYLSAVFRSQATGEWIVAVSTPLVSEGEFIGVLALTVKVGTFASFDDRDDQFWALVDARPGKNQGLILQHRLFNRYAAAGEMLPHELDEYRVPLEELPDGESGVALHPDYRDPMAQDAKGEDFGGRWLAAMVQVKDDGRDTQLVAVVQEKHAAAAAPVPALADKLLSIGMWALGVVAVVMVGLWGFVAVIVDESKWFGWKSFLRRRAGLRGDTATNGEPGSHDETNTYHSQEQVANT